MHAHLGSSGLKITAQVKGKKPQKQQYFCFINEILQFQKEITMSFLVIISHVEFSFMIFSLCI